jgi:hypothetical protein
MTRVPCVVAWALGCAALLASARASAQPADPDRGPPEPVVPSKPEPPLATPDTFIDREMTRPWSEAHTRAFLAGTIDVGYLYLKPRLAVGYGKPFSSWVGLEAAPIASSTEIAAYGGLRVLLGPFDLRSGARFNKAFDYQDLPQQASYSRLDLESTVGGKTTYTALETELKVAATVGPGSIIATGALFYVVGVPAGFDVYEETLHTIARPPVLWWGRGGYDFHFGTQHQHGIALVGDVLYSPERDTATVRAGLLLHFAFSHQFEIRGTFVPTVWSRDGIGLAGDDFTELGLRYRWATGD